MELTPPQPPAPLPWAEEQRFLAVGVKMARRPSLHLRHAPALAAATRALARGAREEEIEARLRQLRARLWRSPFWRERFAAAGGSPDDLRRLEDLAELRPLGRDELAASWREMVDVDGDPELHVATTSGSTGRPLLVPRSGYDGLHMWAVLEHFVSRLGLELPARPRLALLCALPGGLEYSTRAPQWRNGALHRISAIRPGAERRLARVAPAILSTDPAGLHWLVAHPQPARLVLSSASPLAPALRRSAQAALGAPILNYYATTEIGPIAWECLIDPGRFHILAPDVHVESLDGELLVTRLRDSVLPLLRYRTGDRAELAGDPCRCGAPGPALVRFRGREPAPFRRPDGGEVDAWALAWLFKDIPLSRFELVQIAPERFRLLVDPGAAVAPTLLGERVARALIRLGFSHPLVEAHEAIVPLPAKPCPFRTEI